MGMRYSPVFLMCTLVSNSPTESSTPIGAFFEIVLSNCLVNLALTLLYVDSSQRSEATQHSGINAKLTWQSKGYDLRLWPV